MTMEEDAAARGLRKNPATTTITGHRRPQVAHISAVDLEGFRAARDYAKYDAIYLEDIDSGIALDKGAGAVTRNRIAELLQLRSGKWTLLDANLYRREIEQQIDGRIASRLRETADGGRGAAGGAGFLGSVHIMSFYGIFLLVKSSNAPRSSTLRADMKTSI